MLRRSSFSPTPAKGGWVGVSSPLCRVVNCSEMFVRLSIGSSPCEGGGWEGGISQMPTVTPFVMEMRRD